MLVSRNAETCTPTSSRRQPMSNNKGPLPASTTSPSGINPELLYSTSTAVQGITPGIVQPGRGMGRSIAPTAIRRRFAWQCELTELLLEAEAETWCICRLLSICHTDLSVK